MASQSDPKQNVPDVSQIMNIRRTVYTLENYNKTYGPTTAGKKLLSERLKKSCNSRNVAKTLMSYIPVVKVIRKYKLKEYILGDFLAGLTVSFMHLPQGMAFGLLASLRPIYGLYSTFFPVLFYVIFGTSPYMSFGTNAVMALLTQTVVEREAEAFISEYTTAATNVSINQTTTGPSEAEILEVKVGTAMTCSLISGILLALMGILKLGFLTLYLSTSFIGGFTTAAAVHIASSQVPKMFGVKTKSYSGAGKLILLYIDFFRKIDTTIVGDILIAIVSLVILLAVKVGINERYKDKMKMPVPIDLIIVVIATLISYLSKFEDRFDVNIVGSIPSGFESPFVPKLEKAGNFLVDAIVMGILSFAMTISLAKLMAKKHGTKIDDSQELVAYGASNLLSSFFGCFPSATAPPRTMILSSLGSRTTLNGIPTVAVFIFIILLIGRLFETLPIAVLAAMIIASMKDLLLQYRNLPKIWSINKYDFVIWVITNAASVLIDLDYGLIIGVGISILLVVVQNQLASGNLVAMATSEGVLYPIHRQRQKVPTRTDVVVFRLPGSLYFAIAERFKGQIYREVLNPQVYLKELKKKEKKKRDELESYVNETFSQEEEKVPNDTSDKLEKVQNGERYIVDSNSDTDVAPRKPKSVIFDCSMMQYVDMAGISVLQEVTKQYRDLDIQVYLTGVPKTPECVLTKAGFFEKFPNSNVYLDVLDVMEVLRNEQHYTYHL